MHHPVQGPTLPENALSVASCMVSGWLSAQVENGYGDPLLAKVRTPVLFYTLLVLRRKQAIVYVFACVLFPHSADWNVILLTGAPGASLHPEPTCLLRMREEKDGGIEGRHCLGR